jgi:tRNA threonylcarbamoyl adenosine modification protein (Sua5/YciO/YrdC/YwlC family)
MWTLNHYCMINFENGIEGWLVGVVWVRRFDMGDPEERTQGLEFATAAVKRGDLVVLPTDTVYGLGADAFDVDAVGDLLDAKGRGRDMPVPVLVGSPRTVDGITTGLTDAARALIEGFWPGGLTIVARVAPSLQWDLGETGGTVAVRMPLHPVALELLNATGPMAVSSANRTGSPPATTVDEAVEQLGESVAAYLDSGTSGEAVPSTIVDVSGDQPRILRVGDVSVEALREVVPDLSDAH